MGDAVLAVLPVLVLGFVAGILSGMFGIGGGLVIVPALVFLFQTPFKTATGTSLFALLWPVGVLGVVEYWKQGQLNWWHGAWIAVGLFLGAWFGAQITLSLPTATMKKLYAVFLLVAGAWYLFGPDPKTTKTAINDLGVPVVKPAPVDPGQVH
jgi:uncharacterized membrane protein YfcA